MKAYSGDFRQKIVETYEIEKISQRQLAKRFRVALSFIHKLVKQRKQQGHLKPKPHGGGQKLKFSSEQMIVLGELVQQKNDATLKELSEQLFEKTGVKISSSTISRVLKRLSFTLKKKVCVPVKNIPQEFKN